MQTQNLEQLINALQLTFGVSKEEVKAGEDILNQQILEPFFAISLLRIVDDIDQPEYVRLSAIINLKSFVNNYWTIKQGEGHITISNEEKKVFTDSLINIFPRCITVKKIRVQFENIIRKVIRDFQDDWPLLVSQLVTGLQNSTQYEELWSVLSILKQACDVHQYSMREEERQILEALVAQTFPFLETLLQKFLEAYNEQSGELIKAILKIFYYSTQLAMPPYMKDFTAVARWMLFFKIILEAPVPAELALPTEDLEEESKREKSLIWANKKWVSKIMWRMLSKFCNKKYVKEDMFEFAEHIKSNYAITFMELFYKILTDSKQFQASSVCTLGLRYLHNCLKISNTKHALANCFDKLMFNVAIPKMQLTRRDAELWESDPIAYVKRIDEVFLNRNDMKMPAFDLFYMVCQEQDANGSSMLVQYLNYCETIFSKNIDPHTNQPLNLFFKETLLWGFECLVDQIAKISKVSKRKSMQKRLEDMVEKYIIPEFQNPVGFMRARVCHVFHAFGKIKLSNIKNLQLIVEGIQQCLLDNELPVQVAAAISFSSILQNKEAQDLIRPKLNQVLQNYMNLMELIDNDDIVTSLGKIVSNFMNEITPYAQKFVAQIATFFTKYCAKQNEKDNDSDDDSSAVLAAQGCLEAIIKILNAQLSNQTYSELRQVIFPILNFSLASPEGDFINDALYILNLLIYNSNGELTKEAWFYYSVLCYSIVGLPIETNTHHTKGLSEEQQKLLENCKSEWGCEFIPEILVPLKNYIKKGGSFFLTGKDVFGSSLILLTFQLVEKVHAISECRDDCDSNQVLVILTALIYNYQGQIDNLIPQIVDFVIINLKREKNLTNRQRMYNIEVLCVSIWYNPTLIVAYFDSKGLTEWIIETMLSREQCYKSKKNKGQLLFALIQLLSLPQVPNYLLTITHIVAKLMVRFSTKMVEGDVEEPDGSDESEGHCEEEEDFEGILNEMKHSSQSIDYEGSPESDGEGDNEVELYDSPITHYEFLLLMEKSMQALLQNNQPLYSAIFSTLTQEEQEKLINNLKEAKQQLEIEQQNKMQNQ